jgi:hypothetical protein
MRRRLVVAGFGFALAVASLLGASEARAQFHFDYSTGTGDPREWVAYGDSIIAGYCGIFCPATKSYASYFADGAAAENS